MKKKIIIIIHIWYLLDLSYNTIYRKHSSGDVITPSVAEMAPISPLNSGNNGAAGPCCSKIKLPHQEVAAAAAAAYFLVGAEMFKVRKKSGRFSDRHNFHLLSRFVSNSGQISHQELVVCAEFPDLDFQCLVKFFTFCLF